MQQPSSTSLRTLVERLPVPAAINSLDDEETVFAVNDPFMRTFGYTVADIPTVGHWALQAYPDEAYRRETFLVWDAAVAKARAETGRVEAMEFRVTCRDRSVRDVVFGAAVVDDFLVVTLIDVSDMRRATRQLAEMQASLEKMAYDLTDNIPVGTYTMVQPPDGGMASFKFMSRRFLDLCGLDAEEARSDPFKAFASVHPDDYDAWVQKNAHAFAHKLPFREECRVIADGLVRWIVAESQPRGLPDGSTVWEGVLTDISAQKEAEQALAAAREHERLQEEAHRRELESKLRASLTAAAAHEINQPLSRIRLQTQLTLQRHQAAALTPQQTTDYLESILEESQQLVDTIDQMKALLRNVRSEQGEVDLATVVESAILHMRPSLQEYEVPLQWSGPDTPLVMAGDDVQLQTAVVNLLRNAVEAVATLPAKKRLVAVALAAHEDDVEIIVGDSGPGLPADVIPGNLFTSSKAAGMGLGLYLVQTCAENHGGSVATGRSSLGGAEVRIVLPRRPQSSTS